MNYFTAGAEMVSAREVLFLRRGWLDGELLFRLAAWPVVAALDVKANIQAVRRNERMRRKVIDRLMQERVPGIRSHNGYFFRGDFDHVLQGVLFEYVPTGLYVTNFRFPLFDPFGPNLFVQQSYAR
jgi:hypothetical protein